MFSHFEAIPRTMKEFENMEKFWLGFPQALRRIGLEFEEVKKRLQEGKPPFDDEEKIKWICDETLEGLIEQREQKEAAEKHSKGLKGEQHQRSHQSHLGSSRNTHSQL